MDKGNLLIEYYPAFLAQALKLVQDEQDAKDVVQNAILACLEKDRVRDPVKYCYRSVRNQGLSLLRERNKLTPLECSEVLLKDVQESVRWATKEEQLEVLEYLRDKLSPRNRTIIEFYYDKGLTVRQIAEQLGLHRCTVSTILVKIRKLMRLGFKD